jgi:HlyD family secretion protein
LAKLISKSSLKWLIPLAIVVAVGVGGFAWWKGKQNALPPGIVSGNGRVEGTLVDISSKEPLKVNEVLVQEGDLVKPGQVVARLDTTTLESELAEAKAAQAAEEERLAVAEASIVKQKSQIGLSGIEVKRSQALVKQGAGSQRELDVHNSELATNRAQLGEATASLNTARQRIEEAKAKVQTVQTRIDDATLVSTVTGRVLYRLAEPGEVLPPGGKALTLVNLEDLYMEIFLPSADAAKVKIGSEARITVDYDPVHSIAGSVSFVSPEAQFTPKQVETKSEREKLMFRVKIQLPKEIGTQYLERIKTGIRGLGYVRVDENTAWPQRLQNTMQLRPEARR